MRTQLKECRTFEKASQEQRIKAEEKYKELYEKVKILPSGEEVEAMQRKMVDVKVAFESIDVLKEQSIKKVKTVYDSY